VELIYIGDKFYHESGTTMSPIYDIHGGRSDWGFVQIALQNGESVHIRPATNAERIPYENKLKSIKERKE